MKGSIFRHPSPLPVGVSSGYVMTVLGPLPINEMGVTLMHEHILLDASGKWVPPCCCSDRHLAEMPVKMENLGELSLNPLMSRDNCQLFDVDVAIDELTKYRALGGETVVDPTNIGIGRDPKALARIARLTGLNIIMGTGLYLEASHPEWVKISSVEQLTERLIYDLGGAEEKPEVLAGLIGEIGISSRFTPDEEKSLRAAGRASAATGVPIEVHLPGWERLGHRVLEVCDELWCCGSRISSGMACAAASGFGVRVSSGKLFRSSAIDQFLRLRFGCGRAAFCRSGKNAPCRGREYTAGYSSR